MMRMLARPEELPMFSKFPPSWKKLGAAYPFIEYWLEDHQDLIFDNPGT